MAIYSDIRSYLDNILRDWAISYPIDVSWPNVGFKPSNVSYVYPTLLPAETNDLGLSHTAFDDYTGIYQVNVAVQKGTGTEELRAIVDSLLTEFSKGVKTSDLIIVKSWASPQFVNNESWLVVPASIQYRVLR